MRLFTARMTRACRVGLIAFKRDMRMVKKDIIELAGWWQKSGTRERMINAIRSLKDFSAP
jgi:hypothetical protein